jgi:hypothetical protein
LTLLEIELTIMAASVTQHGITAYFDRDATVGQYFNGDYYVVGAVRITDIKVAGGARSAGSVAGRDGAMVNPVPTGNGYGTQGYDDRGPSYHASLNRACPIRLVPGASLVCSESADPPRQYATGNNVFLETAIVLTCEPYVPPSDAFRPQYCSGPKTTHRWRDVDVDRLPALPVGVIAGVEQKLERVQLDHGIGWSWRQMHPYQNMRDYGRDLCTDWGNALLASLSDGDKTTLIRRLVQLGIDLYGILQAGGSWPADGGHGAGRKAPILFAGLLLDVPEMRDLGCDARFQEDAQTFYVAQADVDRGVGYSARDIGLAEWGLRHATDPTRDDASLTSSYRWIGGRWVAQTLAMLATGLAGRWGNPAYFDYVARYRAAIHPQGGVYTIPAFHLGAFDVIGGDYYQINEGPMAVTFVSAGTEGSAASGNVSPGLPAGIQADDVLVCVYHTSDQTAVTMTGDWTPVVQGNGGGTTSRLAVWWHRYNGVSSPSTTVTNAAGQTPIGGIAAFRGCKTSGSPVDVAGTIGTSITTNISHPGVTVVTADSMLLVCNGAADDNSRTLLATYDTAWNEGGTTNGLMSTAGTPDGSVSLFYKTVAAGATGDVTTVMAAGDPSAGVLVALAPEAGGGVVGTPYWWQSFGKPFGV